MEIMKKRERSRRGEKVRLTVFPKFLLLVLIILLPSTAIRAAFIDKGGDSFSSRFVLGQPDPDADISVRLDVEYLASENIGDMVETLFTPESGYEFEFVLSTLDVSDGSDFDAVRDAFGTWVDLPDSIVSVAETTYDGNITLGGTNGENEVSWIPYTGTNWWVDVLGYPPSAIGVTSTWFNGVTGEVLERELHFNDTYMYWYTDTDGAVPSNDPHYVEHIAVHELGHIYGLKDVYNPGHPAYEAWMGVSNEELTMFGLSAALDEDVTLSSMDIAAMAIGHPVPEPMTVLLLASGALALFHRRLK